MDSNADAADWLDYDCDPGLCRYDSGKLDIVPGDQLGYVWARCRVCGATGPIGLLSLNKRLDRG
jgi:hypothetical protein